MGQREGGINNPTFLWNPKQPQGKRIGEKKKKPSGERKIFFTRWEEGILRGGDGHLLGIKRH